MLFRVLAALVVGAIVYLLDPFVGSAFESLKWSLAVSFGELLVANRELIAALAAIAYFIWGRWYPGRI